MKQPEMSNCRCCWIPGHRVTCRSWNHGVCQRGRAALLFPGPVPAALGKGMGAVVKVVGLSWRTGCCRKLTFVSLSQEDRQHLASLLLLLKANDFLMSYGESQWSSGHKTKLREITSVSLPAPLTHCGERFPLQSRDFPSPVNQHDSPDFPSV